MNMKLSAACVALVALAACDSAVAPTQGQAEFNSARATYAGLAGRPTATGPSTGGGTYTGAFSSNATIDGEGGYSVIADMNMNVNFSAAGTNVTGSISDINLIDRIASQGSQLMTNGTGSGAPGVLTISGSQVNSGISATATGQLGAVLANSLTETTTQMNLQMTGRVATATLRGDTVIGTVSGNGNGSSFNGMDVSISSGQFYGRE